MPWRQISFDIGDDAKDAIIGELNTLGASGIWETDSTTGATRIFAYFPGEVDLQPVFAALRFISAALGNPAPSVVEELLQDRDWNEEWKKTYSSFPVGKNFFVVPSWSNSEPPAGRYPIFIDPGQAFGTGTHETTQLTLEALEHCLRPQDVILDLGTGSGILAICASILGAREVVGCDNDPIAAVVASGNAARNKQAVGLFCGSADAVRSVSMDIVLCNVTADVIVAIFGEIDRVLKPGGTAIFSGILNTQRNMILDVLDTFRYTLIEDESRVEWIVLGAVKHGR